MEDFTFSVPQNIIVGRDSRAKLPTVAKEVGGSHAFLLSGPHLNKMGLVEECAKNLEQEGIASHRFTEIEGNPSVDTVERAVAAYRESGADFIVAIGGGSPMDVAKAVGIVAKYRGSITDYEGGGKVPGPIIPLIAIPTTAGTGSEVTPFTVITDESRNFKFTVFSKNIIPTYAILDATLLTTAPASIAAACGMDALVHAIEAYISTAATPFTAAMAEKAMELLGGAISSYATNRENVAAAEEMLVGSMFAGIAFSWAKLGNVHAMSHPVSAYFHVSHGVANAILLPTVLEYNGDSDRSVQIGKKYKKIYEYIAKNRVDGEFESSMLVEEVRKLNEQLGIPCSLSAVGVEEDTLEAMAEDAMKSGNIGVNPRTTCKEDIVEMYRKCL